MTNTIYIDDREDKSRKGKANRAKFMLNYFPIFDKSVEKSHLEVGDVVCGNVAIELKEIEDFVESVKSVKGNPARLFPQCFEMSRNYEHAHVIILGSDMDILNACGEYSIHPEGVYAAMASVSERMNVHINMFSSMATACPFMKYAFEKANDGKSAIDHTFVKRKTASKNDELIFNVSSYPKISSDRAKKILEHFGTIKNVVNATEKEIMEIDGIGKKIADMIVEINNRDYNKVIENE